MDYKRNKRFFDKQFAKKTNVFLTVGIIAASAAALLLIIGWYTYSDLLWMISSYAGGPLLFAGVVIIFVALGRNVKENDLIAQIDALVKEVSDTCAERLKYPSDLDEMSIIFSGCDITEDNVSGAVKLSNGGYLTEEVRVALVYIAKNKLWCYEKRACLTEDRFSVDKREIVFDEFDRAVIETETVFGATSCRFRLYCKGKTVLDLPLTSSDYCKEQFCERINRAAAKK